MPSHDCFQVIVALTLMYFKLGISALLGGLLIVVAAPIQIFVGRGMSQMQKKVMVGSGAWISWVFGDN